MDFVTLMGAADVMQAGVEVRAAAADMRHAASEIAEALEAHRRFMREWLVEFRDALELHTNGEVRRRS